jgi:hypothetical protein
VSTHLSPGASGAIRRFAGSVARGSVGHPMLDGIDYWDELKDSPSQMEICFAIFANKYCTGELPPGEAELDGWEVELY